MREKIHQRDGHDGDDDERVGKGYPAAFGKVDARGILRIGVHDDVLQNVLEGPKPTVALDVNGARGPIVPLADGTEQRNGGDDGHRQRQDDFHEHLKRVCPVKFRRFEKTGRDVRDKVPHQDDTVRADRPRKHEHGKRVDHIIGRDGQVQRDEPAVEHHGKQHDHHKAAAKRQFFDGKRKPCQKRRRNVYDGRRYGNDDGYEKAGIDGFTPEYRTVGRHRKIFEVGKQHPLVRYGIFVPRKGKRQNVEYGNERHRHI